MLGSKEFAEAVTPQKWASALMLTYRDQRGRVEGGWSDDKSMNDLEAEFLYILSSAIDMRYGLVNLMPSRISGGYETVINPDAQDAPEPFMHARARTAISSMHNHLFIYFCKKMDDGKSTDSPAAPVGYRSVYPGKRVAGTPAGAAPLLHWLLELSLCAREWRPSLRFKPSRA